MELVRPQFEPDRAAFGGGGCGVGGGMGGRLNLLLSYAGWESDPWVDRLPRLLEPMGVVSHKAVSGREASSVMGRVRIHVAVVDLALPLETPRSHAKSASHASDLDAPEFSEGGARLLELLSRLEEPPPVVAIKRERTERENVRDMAAALRLGAFAVVDRPQEASDLDVILDVLRRVLARHYEGRWPG